MNSVDSKLHLADALHRLFRGSERVVLLFDPNKASTKDSTGKLCQRDATTSPKRAPTIEDWQAHLAGRMSVGIAPLLADDTCRWGCLDIDNYSLALPDIVELVEKATLPFVVCRSKSGGAHLFLFLTEPAPARDVYDYLRRCAKKLGLTERFDMFPNGSPSRQGTDPVQVNMPYFSSDETERYAVKAGGLALSVAEFLDAAERKAVHPSTITGAASTPRRTGEATGERTLASLADKVRGAAPGDANNQLNAAAFAAGGLCRDGKVAQEVARLALLKAWLERKPEAAAEAEFNNLYDRVFADGMEESNSGSDNRYPQIVRLTKVVGGEEPLWDVYLAGQATEMTITTDQLHNYKYFSKCCVANFSLSFRLMKADTWADRLHEALLNAGVREVPKDETLAEQFRLLLKDFLTDRHCGDSRDDLLLGRPWLDEETRRRVFRFKDLREFIEKKSSALHRLTNHRLGSLIAELGEGQSGKTTYRVKGETVQVRWVRADLFTGTPPLDLPPLSDEPI